MVLDNITIIDIERKIPLGITNPYIVKCSDGKKYVAKFPGNPEGTRVLINEYVCAELAKLLELPIPNFKLINIQGIDKFKEFISVVNKGNFYICCNHGKLRTDAALLMNQYFNPKWDGDKSLKPDAEQIERFGIFYENLTKRDKRDLGFTEEFEKDLCQKLGIKQKK